jgi:hypothetical protein
MHLGDDFMFGAVDRKYSPQFHLGCSGLADFPFHLRRAKNYVRIFCRFQNLFVHAFVTRIASTLSARRIDYDLAGGFPCLGVDMNRAAFQGERAVDRVQGAVDQPMHFRLCGIERQNDLGRCGRCRLRRGCRRRSGEEQDQ